MHINGINHSSNNTRPNFTAFGINKTRFLMRKNILRNNELDSFIPTKIKAGSLGKRCGELEERILNSFCENKINYLYLQKDKGSFLPELNPVIIPHSKPKGNSIFITNFVYPHGSVGGTSGMDEEIITDSLWQCAGIAIVDRKQKLQTLLHINPYAAKSDNKKLIEYVMSHSTPKDMEITLIPGYYDESDATIEYAVSTIHSISPDAKIAYANFPPEVNTYERTVVLRDGELSCCFPKEVKKRKVNPKRNLLYFKPVYHKNSVILNSVETLWEKYFSRFTEYLTYKCC